MLLLQSSESWTKATNDMKNIHKQYSTQSLAQYLHNQNKINGKTKRKQKKKKNFRVEQLKT